MQSRFKARSVRSAIIVLISLLTVGTSQAFTLVASEYPTMVDQKGDASRYKAIAREAFRRMERPLTIKVMRQAFVGSELSAERADGELMFLDMNDQQANMQYSAAYIPVNLHLASRYPKVRDVAEFYHIEDARVATENRFVNTQTLRGERTVKWSRNPTTFDVFRQIGDERSDYLFADKLLIKEFNLVLQQSDRNPLFLSAVPLIRASMHISLRANIPDSQSTLNEFDKAINAMQQDGTFNQLLHIGWLSKDINGDGAADYITSASVSHAQVDAAALEMALAMDNTQPSESSVFVVDGNAYGDLEAVKEVLTINQARESLLDEARYNRMMRDW